MTVEELITSLDDFLPEADVFIKGPDDNLCLVGNIFEDSHINGSICAADIAGDPCIILFPER